MRSIGLRRVMALVMGMALVVAACGGSDDATEDGPAVVAATTWAGAYAALAGAAYIDIVAPGGVTTPNVYIPSAEEIQPAEGTEFVVLTGDESFGSQLIDAAGDGIEVVTVELRPDPAHIEAEVLRLAELFGTTDAAEENLAEVLPTLTDLTTEVTTAVTSRGPVAIAAVGILEWAEWAGVEVAAEFGPEPLTAEQVTELESTANPTLILDDATLPNTSVLGETEATVVAIVSYPDTTLDLVPVFEQNRTALIDALG